MEPITIADLLLINNLSSRTYFNNTLLSNANEKEQQHLKILVKKLKILAHYFSEKYNKAYGPFDTSVTTGNPIAIRGTNLKRMWAGVFKGAENKQYAAQISFVMNPTETCLDVGFYFGRASAHSFDKDQKKEFEAQLNSLGISLSNAITSEKELTSRYNQLFDFGFKASSKAEYLSPKEWLNSIKINPKNSQIVAKIYPNDFGIIENSTIDFFVSQVIFLMGAINNTTSDSSLRVIKPLTPEQRAKQAERLAQIGQKGELFVMEFEMDRLSSLGIKIPNYPKHVALESMHYGYDILSLDANKNEIYIEVKTTTRIREDDNSRTFFISTNEFEIYSNNKHKYNLYRVYDIENSPTLDFIDLEAITLKADGYIIGY